MRCLMLPLVALLLVGGSDVFAAERVPETLLARESAVYFRFDGLKSHRKAFDETVFAKVVDEEFGPLINEIGKRIYDAVGTSSVSDQLLKGQSPKDLKELQKATKRLPQFAALIRDHGFALGVELIAPQDGRFQFTIVCRQGGSKENFPAVVGALRVLASLSQGKVKPQKIGTRTVYSWQDSVTPVSLHCWREGPHAVVTIGSEPPSHAVKVAAGKRRHLAGTALYKKIAAFQRYETWMRGYVNVSASLDVLKKAVPPAAAIIKTLGLEGLKHVAFHAGFQDHLLRSTLTLSVPGERKGVLKLLSSGKRFAFDKLPPFPPGDVSVAAGSANHRAIVDEVSRGVKLLAGAIGDDDFNTFAAAVEKTVKSKIVDDLVASLGSTFATYNSSDEAAFFLGTTVVLEVKDEAKLQRALDQIPRALSIASGVDVSVKKRKYRGATLHMIQAADSPMTPTYVIHKGWLAISMVPQPVMGFVYRFEKGRRKWKRPKLLADAVRESLRSDRKDGKSPEVTGFSSSNPAYSIRNALSYGPLIAFYAQALGGEGKPFDASLIPNAHTVADRLSDNVTVNVDDGTEVRIEGFSTVPMPFPISGLELYSMFAFFPLIF